MNFDKIIHLKTLSLIFYETGKNNLKREKYVNIFR